MKVEQRHEGHGGAVVPAVVQGGPQIGDPSASVSTLCASTPMGNVLITPTPLVKTILICI
jgi:hypothetical protein